MVLATLRPRRLTLRPFFVLELFLFFFFVVERFFDLLDFFDVDFFVFFALEFFFGAGAALAAAEGSALAVKLSTAPKQSSPTINRYIKCLNCITTSIVKFSNMSIFKRYKVTKKTAQSQMRVCGVNNCYRYSILCYAARQYYF